MHTSLAGWPRLHPEPGPAVEAAGADLLARYGEPHRGYHDLEHVAEVLDGVDLLAGHARDADAVRLAAWFHDAVYDPHAEPGSNERASAALAGAVLPSLGHGRARVGRVVRLVLLTATHAAGADDPDGQVLCDADLRVLASGADRYARYVSGVRAEYAHLPDEVFAAGRAQVLEALLAHDRLFTTPAGHEAWETRARANLEAELRRLRAWGRATIGE